MRPLLLLALAGSALSGTALAQGALRVRAALVVVGTDALQPAVMERTEQDLVEVLERSGRYEVAEAAAGESAEALVARCAEDDACWQRAALERGLDLLVVAQLAPEGQRLGALFRLVPAEGPPVRLSAELPRGGGAPLELVDRSLLGPATLRVYDPEIGLTVDGRSVEPSTAELTLPAGKHLLTLEAPGFESRSLTVVLLPGPAHVVSGQLTPLAVEEPSRLRWSYAVAAGVLAGGTALAVVSATQPGFAVPVR